MKRMVYHVIGDNMKVSEAIKRLEDFCIEKNWIISNYDIYSVEESSLASSEEEFSLIITLIINKRM